MHRVPLAALICVAFGVGAMANIAWAESPREHAEQIGAHLKSNRQLLVSGRYRAAGVLSRSGSRDPLQGDIRIASEFDYRRNLICFDISEPIDPNWAPVPAQLQRHRSVFARSPYMSMQFDSLSSQLILSGAADDPPRAHIQELRALDVRSTGITGGRGMFGETFDEALDRFYSVSMADAVEIEDLEGDICKVTLYVGGYRARRQFWFDADAGWTPIKLVVDVGQWNGSTGRYEEGFRLFSCETEWAHQGDGVYVPTRYESQRHRPDRLPGEGPSGEGKSEIQTTTVSLSFYWEGVNVPIDAEQFRYENWDLPKGTSVFDASGVMIKRL